MSSIDDTPYHDDLPVPQLLRQAVDSAIQNVLGRVYAGDAFGRCATYSIVGAQVLSQVLARPYQPVSGGQVLDCGSGLYLVLYPTREARRRARQLVEMTEYHCWVEAQHPVEGLPVPRVEVVDFTARHDAATAALFGVPFTRRHAPAYIWEWADVLARSFPDSLREHPDMRGRTPAWSWVDPQCTALLLDMWRTQPDYYDRLAHAVINSLAALLEPAMAPAPTSGILLPDRPPLAVVTAGDP